MIGHGYGGSARRKGDGGRLKALARPLVVSATAALAAPKVSSVSPNTGPLAGGQTVTIHGTTFTGATAVKFGTTPATSFTMVNSTTITAKTPAHAAGTLDVVVTTAGGTSAVVPGDHYKFT